MECAIGVLGEYVHRDAYLSKDCLEFSHYMAGGFPDSPHVLSYILFYVHYVTNIFRNSKFPIKRRYKCKIPLETITLLPK